MIIFIFLDLQPRYITKVMMKTSFYIRIVSKSIINIYFFNKAEIKNKMKTIAEMLPWLTI